MQKIIEEYHYIIIKLLLKKIVAFVVWFNWLGAYLKSHTNWIFQIFKIFGKNVKSVSVSVFVLIVFNHYNLKTNYIKLKKRFFLENIVVDIKIWH